MFTGLLDRPPYVCLPGLRVFGGRELMGSERPASYKMLASLMMRDIVMALKC